MTASAPATNPLASPRVRLIGAAVVFVAALTLYIATLAPTVTLVDSGELMLAARTLGVAHPPGFPLYVLLAHGFTWLPLGSIAARVNFASALFAALAAATLALAVAELLLSPKALPFTRDKSAKTDRKAKKPPAKEKPADKPGEDHAGPAEKSALALAPCVMAGLLFAFSRTLWGYATVTEVYTLNTLLLVILFFLMFGWRRRVLDERVRSGKATRESRVASPHDRWLNGAALVFGLGLGVHHVSVAVTLPAFALLVFATEGAGFFTSKRLLKAALFAFAGLAIYLYLPLAASRSPLMNWGNPRSPETIWWHVSGRQYQIFLDSSAGIIRRQFNVFLSFAGREFNPVWLPAGLLMALAGLAALGKRDLKLCAGFVLVILCNLAYGLNYEIGEDKDAYYLPTFLVMALAAGYGAAWLLGRLRAARLPVKMVAATAVIVALLVPAVAMAGNFAFNDRHRYFIARDYVDNILSTVEPNGLLLTDDWQVYSPLLYLREVEGVRRDVIAMDIQQLRRSWYYDYLNTAYPELIAAARDKVEAFLEDLRHWEQDPDIYQRDLTLNQRINTRFYDMLEAFVTNQAAGAPVYVTLNIATSTQGQNQELTDWLKKTYDLVPRGLVFQAVGKGSFVEPAEIRFQTRGLNDGSLRFADDDVVKLKVLPVYKVMLTNRGLYLAAYGLHDRAVAAFKEALAIDPNYRPAEQGLNESLRALRKNESGK